MWRFALLLVPLPAFAESLVAARLIRAHEMINPEDIVVSEVKIPGAITEFSDVTGMESVSAIYPGKPILSENLVPGALIERNQIVPVQYFVGGLAISTEARALGRGAIGDFIEIMNLNSKKKIIGQVQPDGSVSVGSKVSK